MHYAHAIGAEHDDERLSFNYLLIKNILIARKKRKSCDKLYGFLLSYTQFGDKDILSYCFISRNV